MDKEEIIRRLKKISEHAVHVTGEPPFIISLDDGIALDEAVSLLKEQEPLKPKSKVRHGENGQIQHFCRKCNAILFHHKQKFCIECGREVKWK